MNGTNHQDIALAGRVRKARRARDWTQEQLAEAAQVAPGTVNRVENAKPVRPGNILAIVDALGLEIQQPEPSAFADDVQLALDLVAKSLHAIPEGPQRHEAVNQLIRFVTMGRN
jgi:transcriptional regulator with XRE-family HTH domain